MVCEPTASSPTSPTHLGPSSEETRRAADQNNKLFLLLIHPGTFTQKPCPMFQLDAPLASTPIKGGSTSDKDTSARNVVDKGTFLDDSAWD